MKLQFQRAKLKDVLQFYVEHYRLGLGQKMVGFDFWLDPVKGEVLFELAIEDEKVKKSDS